MMKNLFYLVVILILANTGFGEELYTLPWFREHLSSEEFHHRPEIPFRERRNDPYTTHRPSVADILDTLNNWRYDDPRSFNGTREQLSHRLWEVCYNSSHMNKGRAGQLGEHWKNDDNISRECWRILREELPSRSPPSRWHD